MSYRSWRLIPPALVCALAPVALAAPPAPYQHVLVLSIDGLHAADLTDPASAQYLPDVLDLAAHGVRYSNAHAVTPSDNFPNVIAQFTGATPKTSGIYYDDTFRRNYFSGGLFPGDVPGTAAHWTGDIDWNPSLLNGGGNSDGSSINPNLLPQIKIGDNQFRTIYPHDDLKVNTAFEVAKAAGLRTAFIDKHPSYEILNGPSGHGIDDFYAPESDADGAIVNGVLVDPSTAPPKTKFKSMTKTIPLSEAYDDYRLDALLNQVNGLTSRGAAVPAGVPNLFGFSFVAVNTAQKDRNVGGIFDAGQGNGQNLVNSGLADALQHTNDSVRRIVNALKEQELYDKTLIVLTAKHGQSPRLGGAANILTTNEALDPLYTANIQMQMATQDDVSLIWLVDSGQAAAAKTAYLESGLAPLIEDVLIGQQLVDAGLASPATDDRAPDLIVKFKPNVLVSNSLKLAEHGGFSEDDTGIALILSGGIPLEFQGSVIDANVLDTQLAPTMLAALGLDPNQLQGVQQDGTQILPGAPVPEPTAVALLAACGFARFLRRQRRDRGVSSPPHI